MKVTTWAVLGSLAINLALALTVAALFSAAPAARGAAPAHCAMAHTLHSTRAVDRPAAVQRDYLVAVRMGWAG